MAAKVLFKLKPEEICAKTDDPKFKVIVSAVKAAAKQADADGAVVNCSEDLREYLAAAPADGQKKAYDGLLTMIRTLPGAEKASKFEDLPTERKKVYNAVTSAKYRLDHPEGAPKKEKDDVRPWPEVRKEEANKALKALREKEATTLQFKGDAQRLIAAYEIVISLLK